MNSKTAQVVLLTLVAVVVVNHYGFGPDLLTGRKTYFR